MILRIHREITLLHPDLSAKAQKLIDVAREQGITAGVFETWRSSARQYSLYAQGRTDGDKRPTVTNARGWESWHQYGLAFDVAFRRGINWTWEGPVGEIRRIARDVCGLRLLGRDDPLHFELAGVERLNLDEVKILVKTEGQLAVWGLLG